MATWRFNNSTLLGGEVLSVWQANHTYAVGARCVCTSPGPGYPDSGKRVFECTTGGQSGGSEPTWATIVGNTTSDNAAIWTTRSPTDGTWDNATLYYSMTSYTGYQNFFQSGDTLLFAHTHYETLPATSRFTPATYSKTNPYKFYSVDKSTDMLTTGATLYRNGSGYLGFLVPIHAHGMRFKAIQQIEIMYFGGDGTSLIEMNDPSEIAVEISAGSYGRLHTGSQFGGKVHFKNASIKLTQADAAIHLGNQGGVGHTVWQNGTLIAPSGVNELFIVNSPSSRITGVDFSQVCPDATVRDFFKPLSSCSGDVELSRCKMPSGSGFRWNNPATPFVAEGAMRHEMRLFQCSTDNTSYRYRLAGSFGEVLDDETFIRTGGASDGVTSYSCKMVTLDRTVENLYAFGLSSIPIVGFVEAGSQTVTIEGLIDSATALQNDEIWMEIDYQTDALSGIGVVDDNKCATLGTPADVTTSSSSWYTTGMANPRPFKLSMTITPGKRGAIEARVLLAKRSTTIYIDPLIIIT